MTMRLAGITGMFDTDAMVKAQLEPYKLKVTTKTQEKDLLELKQKQYRGVLKDIKDFYNKYISTSKSDSLMLAGNYKSLKFTPSNDAVVTAKANSTASSENYTINVKTLAANATDTLPDPVAANTDLQITIGAATPITTIKFKAGATGTETVANYNKAVSDRKTELTAKTTPLTTDEQQELNDLTNIVVDARYNTIDKGVVFTSAKAGTGGFTLNANAKKTDTALDAEIVNSKGNRYRMSASEHTSYTNEVTIDGVTFNFKSVTDATDGVDAGGKPILTGGTPAKLTAGTDVSGLKDKIVSFVNDYNTLITNLNTKLSEKRYRTMMPLTTEQRADMDDSQIKLWEEKVNSGLIRKDNDVERIVSQMKSGMRTMMSGSGLKLESIGITPVKNYGETNGTFLINEDKLTNALQNNMDGVKQLFLKDTPDVEDNATEGILTNLKSLFDKEVISSSATLVKKVGLEGSISDETSQNLDKMQTQIDEMNTALTARENSLYTKYATLESSMNALNSQETWLTQQFSS